MNCEQTHKQTVEVLTENVPSMGTRGLLVGLLLLSPVTLGKKPAKRKRKASGPTPPPSADHMAAMSHHQRGTMAHVQGDVKGAIAAFRAAIEVKPDFAYAYYRLGFVLHELRSAHPERVSEDPVPAFRAAIAIDPKDEMAHYSLGQALQDDERLSEAAAVFEGITTKLNPRSAQAYWALGKVRAKSVDEFDADPDDPMDPSHCYEQAARLQPEGFKADGTRVRKIEPRTPEVEEREKEETKARRERVLAELKAGTRTFKYADEL